MEASLIISTYNSVDWLEKVLFGIQVQTYTNFELIIADDGSGAATKELIARFRADFPVPVVHVWQPDNGFQKTKILNKAILASTTDYLIFTDGDCILREDFIAVHMANRQRGFFLSGGYFKLPLKISQQITQADIRSQNCFSKKWLIGKGLKSQFKNIKLTSNKRLALLLNFITPTRATWNGHNTSGWKEDLVLINGFDERMGYGGEDRELGERLVNMGLRSKQIRYTAICIHLSHNQEYVSEEIWALNNSIRRDTRKQRTVRCVYGLDLHKGEALPMRMRLVK
jgi:glycosyltransferase involved in cell wall biosynthesis